MTVLKRMQTLRRKGWLVVLKAMPKGRSFIIPGSRSEYDALK